MTSDPIIQSPIHGPDQFIDFFLYEENIDLLNGLNLSISSP